MTSELEQLAEDLLKYDDTAIEVYYHSVYMGFSDAPKSADRYARYWNNVSPRLKEAALYDFLENCSGTLNLHRSSGGEPFETDYDLVVHGTAWRLKVHKEKVTEHSTIRTGLFGLFKKTVSTEREVIKEVERVPITLDMLADTSQQKPASFLKIALRNPMQKDGDTRGGEAPKFYLVAPAKEITRAADYLKRTPQHIYDFVKLLVPAQAAPQTHHNIIDGIQPAQKVRFVDFDAYLASNPDMSLTNANNCAEYELKKGKIGILVQK